MNASNNLLFTLTQPLLLWPPPLLYLHRIVPFVYLYIACHLAAVVVALPSAVGVSSAPPLPSA